MRMSRHRFDLTLRRDASRAGRFAALCLVSVLAIEPLEAQTRPNPEQSELSRFSSSLDNLAQRVSPAVVQVDVTRYAAMGNQDRNNTGMVERQGNIGSGFLVDSDGYIITNAHVVMNALRIRVLLTGRSGSSEVNDNLEGSARLPEQEAQIVGIDPIVDIALLKIDGSQLPTLSFADYTKLPNRFGIWKSGRF
jgi:serine protease Do